ncbi:MAG: phosphatidate cytidylyltransferase [Candidatus Magasanikbacteria bacterium]
MASKQKVVSGLLLGAGALGLLMLVGYVPETIDGVVLLAVALGSYEYSKIALAEYEPRGTITFLQTNTMILGYLCVRIPTWGFGQQTLYNIMSLLIQITLVGMIWLKKPQDQTKSRAIAAIGLMGFGWLVWLPSAIPLITMLEHGIFYLTLMLASAVFADIGAGLGGSTFRKKGWKTHAFAPSISPKKTWEGTIAGFFAAILMACTACGTMKLLDLEPAGVSTFHALALGMISGICGPIGDLVESWFKRHYGVKDSGSLIPGHGGILDRVDGIIFVGPPFLLYVTQVIQ